MNQIIQEQAGYMIWAFSNTVKKKVIDERRFTELKTKFDILRILRYAEYHYASIGRSYKSFEMSLFEVTFDFKLGNENTRGIEWSGQQKIHISLMALLNTIHTYLENLEKSHIKKLKELTQENMSEIENQFAQSYDTRIEYRIMKVLRNYITHTPYADIHGSRNSKIENKTRDTKNSPWRIRDTGNPAIVIDLLTKDRKLKEKYKKDLMQMKKDGYNKFDVKFKGISS